MPLAVAEGSAPVLRGRALETVDERGRVRASLEVPPAGTQPNGEKYAETALLRPITERGQSVGESRRLRTNRGLSFARPTGADEAVDLQRAVLY
ncbi:MAG: hypothetical protein WBO23_11810 [Burkholderiales bacterium]